MDRRPLSSIVFAVFALLVSGCGRAPGDRTIAAYLKAAALFDSGRFAEAAASSAAIRRFVPAAILRGKAFFFLGKEREAESALRFVLREKPSSLEARVALARVLRARGENEKARIELDRALADAPHDAAALRLAAELSSECGDIGTARAFLDRAAEAGSETALAFLDRARLRWAAGESDGALADIRASRAILPPESAAARAAAALEAAIAGAAR